MPKGRAESEDGNIERNKIKKIEMPVSNGEDPNSWLFRVNRFFQIYRLIYVEKLLVASISFEGPALN